MGLDRPRKRDRPPTNLHPDGLVKLGNFLADGNRRRRRARCSLGGSHMAVHNGVDNHTAMRNAATCRQRLRVKRHGG